MHIVRIRVGELVHGSIGLVRSTVPGIRRRRLLRGLVPVTTGDVDSRVATLLVVVGSTCVSGSSCARVSWAIISGITRIRVCLVGSIRGAMVLTRLVNLGMTVLPS